MNIKKMKQLIAEVFNRERKAEAKNLPSNWHFLVATQHKVLDIGGLPKLKT